MEENKKTILSRIRENMGVVVAVIAISLLAFVLSDFFQAGQRMSGVNDGIGTIAGEKVSYKEFNQKYESRLNMYQEQGQNLTDADRYQIMDMVWNNIVSDKIFDKQFQSLGLNITAEELQDMFIGNNISPAVQQYFANFFKSQNKPFNVEDVKQYLSLVVNDPNYAQEKPRLKEFEDYLVQFRMREKFDAMVANGYISSKAQAKRKHIDQNRKANVTFMGVNFSQISDSTIKVDDNELRAYISKHPERFKQSEQTIIRYVQYDLKPTKADSLKAKEDVLKWKEKFAAATNDSTFVYSRTRNKYNPKQSFPLKDLPAEIKDSVKSVAPNTVFGPVLVGDAYKLYKLISAKKGDVVNAKVSHILITPKATTAADSAAALAEATAIKATVNATNFAQVVMEKSQDNASKMNGGSLGWYTPGSYGKAFDDAVKAAGKGAIVGPVKSPQGYHILFVEDKTDEAFQVAEVEKIISVTEATSKALYNDINTFAAKAQEAKDVEAAGKAAGVMVRTSNPLENNTKMLGNLPARQLILWAIKGKEGEFSKIETLGDSYVFAQIYKKKKEGVQDVEDVRQVVMREVLNEKKGKMILEKLEKLQGKSLEEMKNAYGNGAFVSSANDITFESASIPGIGNDPYVIGKVAGMAKGTTSKPLVGKNGVYVLQVTEVVEAPAIDDNGLVAAKKSAALGGQNTLKSKIEQALTKMADVKDERHTVGM